MEKVKGVGHNNVVTTWTFRDGEQVVVSLTVHENPKSLVIRIADKITAEEWSCQYDLKYVEDLTQRTGNYKSFDVFVAMIKSALLKSTDSVELDLMTYEDLKTLKNKRLGGRFGGQFLGSSVAGDGNDGDPNGNNMSPLSSSCIKRKYLIVIYIAEFDSVHYPLPLTYTGAPDPVIMQNNIKKLQAEVTFYRNTNQELAERLKELEEDGDITGRMRYCRLVTGQQGSEEPRIHELLGVIRSLEHKSATERMEHMKEMETLLNENNHLRDQITELQLSEEDLNLQITRLEKMATQNLRRRPSTLDVRQNEVRSAGRPLPRRDFRTGNVGGGNGSRSRSRHNSAANSECGEKQTFGNSRITASGTADRKLKFARDRSRTVSPGPKFDPTWYVQERKLRQEEIARTRLSQIKSGMPRRYRQLSGYSTPVGSESGQSPRYGQVPGNTELRLAAHRERSLSRDREAALLPSTLRPNSTNRGRSLERRRGQGLLAKPGIPTLTATAPNALGKGSKPKPVKLVFGNVKSTKLGNEKGLKKTTTGSIGTKEKKSAKEFEGSLEALQAYIEDTSQKLSAYKHFGNVFAPEK